MPPFRSLLSSLADGHILTREEAFRAFEALLSDQVTPAQAGAFLMALRVRGEDLAEIIGAVSALRARMVPVEAPANTIDIVGTGGDHSGSYNVSTLAAILAASCGVGVAKHGNRAASSRSGAADVLTALGVNLISDPEQLASCLREVHLCFLFAQNHHPSMRHVAPIRAELGLRTIFNLLGPLSNPAGVRRQLLGVFSERWLEPLTQALAELGSTRVWTVHGSDGLDEITTTGPTHICTLENGTIRRFTLDPREYGLPLVQPEALKGGSPEDNAKALLAVLKGEHNAYRDIALINSAAALVVAEAAEDLHEALSMAAKAIDSGKALATLEALVQVTNA